MLVRFAEDVWTDTRRAKFFGVETGSAIAMARSGVTVKTMAEGSFITVRFYPLRFTPASSHFKGKTVEGIGFDVTNRDVFSSSRLGLELAAALRPTGVTVQTVVVDLRTAHGVRAGMQAALAPLGGVLDILVPNVGALIAGPFETLESGQLQEAFAINFFTHVYACRVAVPLMKERGGGCIVFTGSDQALQPDGGLGPYAQAKAATHCFAKMLARELAADGIRVNVVAPGMTRTPPTTTGWL